MHILLSYKRNSILCGIINPFGLIIFGIINPSVTVIPKLGLVHFISYTSVKAKARCGDASLGSWLFSQGQAAYKPFMRYTPPGITDRPISNYKHCFMGLTCPALPLDLNIKYRYTA